jgi:lipid-A-disaccharide synthase-like uncharacterized protein
MRLKIRDAVPIAGAPERRANTKEDSMAASEGFLQPLLSPLLPWLYRDSLFWTAFGLLGNLLFSSRFLIQWLLSERRRRLVVPAVFWHLSFWGSLVALVYAFHVDKLPIILGYVFLPVIYGRNLVLLGRERKGPGGIEAEQP